MIFNKRKNDDELRQQRELAQQFIDEEKNRMEEKLQSVENIRKEEHIRADFTDIKTDVTEEKPAKSLPYKFSEPSPMPKELVSVLREMFKKLFPDARKAFLVLTEYEEKRGYLLVVDIDAKFLKIINIYLDGQTKKVRNGYPIECILYSKSGNLTEGMTPFYVKEVPETPKSTPRPTSAVINDVPELGIDAKTIESINYEFGATPVEETPVAEGSSVAGFDEETATVEIGATENVEEKTMDEEIGDNGENSAQNEDIGFVDDINDDEIPSLEVVSQPVKVEPETKQQLFALMNRAGDAESEDVIALARSGFEEYKFYVPFDSDSETTGLKETFDQDAGLILLISRDTGIKAIAFFTDLEDVKSFAEEKGHSYVCIKYRDYKEAVANGTVIAPSAEGIIINPTNEKILLAPDYPLL